MFDLLNEIVLTLRTNKLRTMLTGFAVSWGIFLLIVLLSVANGVSNRSKEFMTSVDNEVLQVYGGWTSMPYKGYQEGREISLETRDMRKIESRNASHFNDISARISKSGVNVSTGRDYVADGYDGVSPQAVRTDGIKVSSGRFINETDMKERRRVVVLNRKTADVLFEPGSDPIGQLVTINELTFKVVGIYNHDWNRRIFIPFTVAQSMAGGDDEVSQISAHIRGAETLEETKMAERGIRETLSRAHDFDPNDESAVWIWNRFENYLNNRKMASGLNIAVWVLGILTLISSIVGVSNIMFVSVRERTHEIGIRRAIGARPASILRQIIFESVAITTFFGYIGIVAGMLVAALIGALFATGNNSPLKDPGIDISIALQVTAVLIIAGALAGLFPALKSLKIRPVEALRDE